MVYTCASGASRGAHGKFAMAKLKALVRQRRAVLRLISSQVSKQSKSLGW